MKETLPDGWRRCKRCRQVKPISHFPEYRVKRPNGTYVHGIRWHCEVCLAPLPALKLIERRARKTARSIGADIPELVDVQKIVSGRAIIEGRIPIIYGYGRVSTDHQAEEGKSIETQASRITAYYESLCRIHGKTYLWGGCYLDPGTSAYKIPFANRPAGSVLASRVLPGDHIVMTSLDRGFRNFKDAINTFETWLDRGIYLHLIDMGVTTDNHIGRMILRMLSVCAQFQRDMTSQAIQASLRRLRKEGKMVHELVDLGWRVSGPKGHRVIIADHAIRRACFLIAKLVDVDRWNFYQVYQHLRDARLPVCDAKPNRQWSHANVMSLYRRFKANPTFQQIKLERMAAGRPPVEAAAPDERRVLDLSAIAEDLTCDLAEMS